MGILCAAGVVEFLTNATSERSGNHRTPLMLSVFMQIERREWGKITKC